jgi:hypothetical protein
VTVESNRPFADLITQYVVFRQALTGCKVKNSLTKVLVTHKDDAETGEHHTELLMAELVGQEPLDLKGYLSVMEREGLRMARVKVMRHVVGARNDDIEVAELWVNAENISDYLIRFYLYLATDFWES